ncbi:DUF4345 domain-containing protein [Pararhizobium haloflavum]|uniref:DUF4345 domain-containing protein n=1 Tax=Pararhizobium haloflavum TaxID=2037914 RepID=UPI000C1920E8|nr:DUF4345 domain-containing protein [Pararhizobium haloflavum]
MPAKSQLSLRLLQATVATLALVPISAGLLGVLRGPAFLGLDAPPPTDLDSHLRFLSGVFLALGLAWWSCIPAIETKTARFRLLACATVVGGLARLASLGLLGAPSAGHMAGLFMELVVVPLLVFWQARLARRPTP